MSPFIAAFLCVFVPLCLCVSFPFSSYPVRRLPCAIAAARNWRRSAGRRRNSFARKRPSRCRPPTDLNTVLIICATARRNPREHSANANEDKILVTFAIPLTSGSLDTPGCFIGWVATIDRPSTLVTIYLVAVEARFADLIADLAYGSLVPGLRRFVGSLSCLRKFQSELHPLGILHWDGLAVLAPASGRQHEWSGLGQGHRRIIDKFPS